MVLEKDIALQILITFTFPFSLSILFVTGMDWFATKHRLDQIAYPIISQTTVGRVWERGKEKSKPASVGIRKKI